MQQQIEKLALESGAWHQVYGNRNFMIDEHFDIEKFAELIVRECVGICEGKTDHLDPNMYEVWRGALACASDIKVHFGVEE